jgi:multidrug efflux pump subunit AcrA (membrane-fusion protein)
MKRVSKILALSLFAFAIFAGVMDIAFIQHGQRHGETVAWATGAKVIYHCPMHPQYFSDKPGACPICGMKLVPVNEAEAGGEAGTVKIDPTVVQNMGVTTETVTVRDLSRDIRASTTIELNETAISNVNTKVMGWVDKLYIDYTGQRVKKGQPLFTIYSPDLVSTQEEYLQALQYEKNLTGGSPGAEKGALELVESSKRRLLNWDIPETEIDAVAKSGAPRKTMTIYSPTGGVVLEKMVVTGQNVMPGMELYKIADLSTVWAVADVYQEDLPFIKLGSGAEIEVASATGKTFTGKVDFISPVLDPTTKTAAVRISIRNTTEYLLKPGMFATIKISSPLAVNALSVSEKATLHTGKRDLVILALGGGYFKPQEVSLGVSANGYTQILSGLSAGATIVTSSQFLIDAESNLRQTVGQMGGKERPADTEEMDSTHR